MDRNRVDVVVESYWLQYSSPEGASGEGRRQTFLAARQLGADSTETEVRNKQIGGGGRLGGLPRSGGKAGDTF